MVQADQDECFFGGVIYIDLRGYSNLVEDKPLPNIAKIIYQYQDDITSRIKEFFISDKIMTIEYMGDGILAIIKYDLMNMINIDRSGENDFELKLYTGANELREFMVSFIIDVQNNYKSIKSLDELDFGMGISCSQIFYHEFENSRKAFIGTSLNRAAKIGDAMNKKKNNIGIDLELFEKIKDCNGFGDNSTSTRTNLGRVNYVHL